MNSLTPHRSDAFRTRWGTRLADSELRRRLRSRPGLQGKVLAPAGAFRRLPRTAGLYFPFYHDIPQRDARQFRVHLLRFRELGPFVSWNDALEILAGRRELSGP